MSNYLVKYESSVGLEIDLVSGDYSYKDIVSKVQDLILDPTVKILGVIESTISTVSQLQPMLNNATFTLRKDADLKNEDFEGEAVYLVSAESLYGGSLSMLFSGDKAFDRAREHSFKMMSSDNQDLSILKISVDFTKYTKLHPRLDGFNFTIS